MSLLVKESKIEKDVVKWAEDNEVMVIKLNLHGRRGWPDRLFILPNGGIIWVEFKRPGEKPRKLQDYIHGKLRKYKQDVYVADRAFDTISYIKARMGTAPVSETGDPFATDSGVCGSVSRPWFR